MSTVPAKRLPQKIVVCPACKGDSVYSAQNMYRPFCSQRCKNIDFGAWASEDFKMAVDTAPDDATFGDPKLQ